MTRFIIKLISIARVIQINKLKLLNQLLWLYIFHMAVINALKADIHTCIYTDFRICSKKTLAVTNSPKFQDEAHDRGI